MLPRGVGRERDAGTRLAHGVDLQQVLCHVLHDLARAPSRARPVRGAQPVQRRSPLRPAQIFLHAVEVFNWHEEAVALRVLELEVLAVRAIRLDEAHALEVRDPVIDVHDELVRFEVERELAGHVPGLRPSAPRPRRTPDPPEQLGVGGEVEPDLRLGAACGDVHLGVEKRRLDLEVQVEVDFGRRGLHAGLIEQRANPFALLGGEDDRCALTACGEPGEGAGLADQRLPPKPPEIDRFPVTFARCDGEARPRAELVEAVDGGQHELRGKLAASCLGRGQHRGLVEQRARLGQLAPRLEIDDHCGRGQVIEQRWPRRVEVGGIELDAGKGRTGFQARQVVLPLRAHIAAQPAQRHRVAQPLDSRPATLRPDQ